TVTGVQTCALPIYRLFVPGLAFGFDSGLLRAQLGHPLAVEIALDFLAVGAGELFECLLRIIGQFGLGLGGLGGLTRGGRALAPGCLVLRLFAGGDGGLIIRILRKRSEERRVGWERTLQVRAS